MRFTYIVYSRDTLGCILVGENPRNKVGIILPQLINSRIKFNVLEKFLSKAIAKNETIKVIVKEDRRDFCAWSLPWKNDFAIKLQETIPIFAPKF